jgi:hypothetical protein
MAGVNVWDTPEAIADFYMERVGPIVEVGPGLTTKCATSPRFRHRSADSRLGALHQVWACSTPESATIGADLAMAGRAG